MNTTTVAKTTILPTMNLSTNVDIPLMALIRQEWMAWHQRKFVTTLAKYWPLSGESKTVHSCHTHGLFYGLQGIHARFVFSQYTATLANRMDPLLPYAPNMLDIDSMKELIFVGLSETNAKNLFTEMAIDMANASLTCASVRTTLMNKNTDTIHGRLHALFPTMTVLENGSIPAQLKMVLVFQPDGLVIEQYLKPIRNEIVVSDRISFFGHQMFPLYDTALNPSIQALLHSADIHLTPFTSVLEINMRHYIKLAFLHRLVEAGVDDPSLLPESDPFHVARPCVPNKNKKFFNISTLLQPSDTFLRQLYCLVARYETLSGNTGAIQGAIPHNIFDILETTLDIKNECFASPLNCHFPRFYSAFPDTDIPFGSLGSFFDFCPLSGSYEVNPPFVNTFMVTMTQKLETLLSCATDTKQPLLFFVIVPLRIEALYYKLLSQSCYCRIKYNLIRKEHVYIDGLQHRADRITWNSNIDSTFFVLATETAVSIYGLGDTLNAALGNAFKHKIDEDMNGRVCKFIIPLASET